MNEHTPAVDWRTTLADAHRALAGVTANVPDWTRPTPCAEWTAAQVLQHAVGDQQAYTSALTGAPGPSFDPFAPTGDLGEDPAKLVAAVLTDSAAAWADVADDATDVPNPLPQGPLPAWLAAGAAALDAGVHAWDIAVATGQASPLGRETATALLTVAREIVEPLRQYGAYATALEAHGNDPATELLAYLGRRP